MNGEVLDPGGAHERLAAWKGRIDGLAAATKAMSDRLQEVRVTVGDPTGLAEVTIDSTGALVGLRLTRRIQLVDPTVVADTIMATLGEARSGLADRSREIIEDTIGTESPVARAIADSVGQHLNGSPAPERAVAPRDDDEDYDSRSYLRER